MNESEILKILLNAAKDITLKYQNFEVAHQINNAADLIILQEKPLVQNFLENF